MKPLTGAKGRLWVKICGTTSLEDAQCAVSAGADALGFVFAPSSRRVTGAQVAAITAHLPTAIESYGVFVHPEFADVMKTVEHAGLSGVQLHASDDPTLARRLRDRFDALSSGKYIKILRVIHYPANGEGFGAKLGAAAQDLAADGVLVDSRAGAAQGGTGLRFDWRQAKKAFIGGPPHTKLIVAGGLTPENVAEAIATLRPWGIDVVTGVEAEPGRKDPARVRAFLDRARAASHEQASKSMT